MSQIARIPASPGATRAPVDDLGVALAISPGQRTAAAWRVFTSMRAALAMILCLVALAAIGTLIVQAPSGVATDGRAHAAWIESVRPRYGGWTALLDDLQLFSVFSSIWFRAIVIGLATSTMACSITRFRRLWRTAVHPRTKTSAAFYERAPISARVETSVAPEAALETLRRIFAGRHFRVLVEREGDDVHVYAERYRWAPFGSLMAHLSLVLIYEAFCMRLLRHYARGLALYLREVFHKVAQILVYHLAGVFHLIEHGVDVRLYYVCKSR
jgi:hypothetical protein